ncbi:MAG: hypothetical protein ACRET1_07230, partial [Burkholderiales bacterium]
HRMRNTRSSTSTESGTPTDHTRNFFIDRISGSPVGNGQRNEWLSSLRLSQPVSRKKLDAAAEVGKMDVHFVWAPKTCSPLRRIFHASDVIKAAPGSRPC